MFKQNGQTDWLGRSLCLNTYVGLTVWSLGDEVGIRQRCRVRMRGDIPVQNLKEAPEWNTRYSGGSQVRKVDLLGRDTA